MKSEGEILIGHGSGGLMTEKLIKEVFLPHIKNEYLEPLEDASLLSLDGGKYAFTTDSYTVKPHFFPGGDIGKLAAAGTINDLVVSGAVPLFMSAGFLLEEGFSIDNLGKIVTSFSKTLRDEEVYLITGDTKVVERGKGDGVYINTSGIGVLLPDLKLGFDMIEPGDSILITGSIGDHGAAIVVARGELGILSEIESDCAPLSSLLLPLLKEMGEYVKWMRDPTRGGVATALNDVAKRCGYDLLIFERELPVKEEVEALCEMLGFDPLYLANEGKAILIVDSKKEEEILKRLREHPLGREARKIGQVTDGRSGRLFMETVAGGTRIVDSLIEDQVPRIC